MKGSLFQHPTIVLELLRCITPLDYMMLRRATPIFMRNPKVYPSVEDMGAFSSCVCPLLCLYGKDVTCKPPPNFNDSVNISGVQFIENVLQIRNLEAVRTRTFTVSTISYAYKYLLSAYSLQHVLNLMIDQITEYELYWFTVVLQHDDRDIFDYMKKIGRGYDQVGALWNLRIYYYMKNK